MADKIHRPCGNCVPCLKREVAQLTASNQEMRTRLSRIGPRLHWEAANRQTFDEDFQETQKEGVRRFGMRFVEGQEAAMAAFGGIYPQFDTQDFVTKAWISRAVMTVMGRLGLDLRKSAHATRCLSQAAAALGGGIEKLNRLASGRANLTRRPMTTRRAKKAAAKPVRKAKFYLIEVTGVEIDLRGPYGSPESRLVAAQDHRRRQNFDDGLFWLTIDAEGRPTAGSYGAKEIDPQFRTDGDG
jgi:hypothetical protein